MKVFSLQHIKNTYLLNNLQMHALIFEGIGNIIRELFFYHHRFQHLHPPLHLMKKYQRNPKKQYRLANRFLVRFSS